MAAGGYKEFVAGETLDQDEINNYLMQGMLVFAGTAARGSAIGTPVEGQFTYLADTDAVEFYDGSQWTELSTGPKGAVVSGTTGSPTVTSGTVIDGFTFDLYTFTGDGSITISVAGFLDVLTVGGGGGGRTDPVDSARRAGGGGGGVRLLHAFVPVDTYTVTVGAGGAASNDGSLSSLGSIAQVGGGGQGRASAGVNLGITGLGGGGSSGGLRDGSSGFVRGGGAGGTVSGTNNYDGHPVTITGSSVTYGFANDTGTAGSANTGDGGGAGNTSGGSGIVIVRVLV